MSHNLRRLLTSQQFWEQSGLAMEEVGKVTALYWRRYYRHVEKSIDYTGLPHACSHDHTHPVMRPRMTPIFLEGQFTFQFHLTLHCIVDGCNGLRVFPKQYIREALKQ